jgi:nicotinate dehydrogenase subunit A
MSNPQNMSLTVNGRNCGVNRKAHSSLLEFIRGDMKLTGTKIGCAMGDCGACTVIVDGSALQSCQLKLSSVFGSEVETVEAVVQTSLGGQIADALTQHDAAQCGYCLPGIVVAAYIGFMKAETPDIRDMLASNICRCGTHLRILRALQEVKDSNGSKP